MDNCPSPIGYSIRPIGRGHVMPSPIRFLGTPINKEGLIHRGAFKKWLEKGEEVKEALECGPSVGEGDLQEPQLKKEKFSLTSPDSWLQSEGREKRNGRG